MGTIISFCDDNERPRAEVILANGDTILLALDRSGLTIMHIGGRERPMVLFRGDPIMVSHLCASLVTSTGAPETTPLRILLATVVQLASAELMQRAFRDAAERIA